MPYSVLNYFIDSFLTLILGYRDDFGVFCFLLPAAVTTHCITGSVVNDQSNRPISRKLM